MAQHLLTAALLLTLAHSACKYITTEDDRSYQLDKCSHSSSLYGANVSWGFYCVDSSNDTMMAVYRQFDNTNCEGAPSIELYEIDCNGELDGCDCVGFGDEDECS